MKPVPGGRSSREQEGGQRVLRAWRSGRFELIASPQLLAELARSLQYPKLARRVSHAEAQRFMAWIAADAIAAPDPDTDPPIRSEDPGDDYLIALAASQRAVLVSGDDHLLRLTGKFPIYSPKDFLDLLEAEGGLP